MPATLTIHDENSAGEKLHSFTLEGLDERMPLREIIRARIYQEVRDHNQSTREVFCGLVQPSDTERTLNGFKFSKPRPIDWEAQYARALEAFERNGFFVLIGDRQAANLDEEFDVKADTEISFVKLMPLVGG